MAWLKPTRALAILVTLTCAHSARAAEPTTLPAAPEGYSWEKCVEINGALLRPAGWHFLHEQSGDTEAYFVTKESIEGGKHFETGMTVNVVKDVAKKTGVKPSSYARAFLKEAQSKMPAEKTWEEEKEGLKVLHALVSEKEGEDPLRLHYMLVANDKTGTLHILFFESPKRLWEKNGPVGEELLKQARLDAKR